MHKYKLKNTGVKVNKSNANYRMNIYSLLIFVCKHLKISQGKTMQNLLC